VSAGLVIARPAVDAIARAYEAALPFESAGFLLGPATHRNETTHAGEIALLRPAAVRGEFEVSDHDLRRIETWAEDRHLTVVALFHSHPSGDRRLSTADRRSLGGSPWPWVITTRGQEFPAVELTAYAPGSAATIPCRIGTPITLSTSAASPPAGACG
jgi:proteasome lid subunit RPN8/RPN11